MPEARSILTGGREEGGAEDAGRAGVDAVGGCTWVPWGVDDEEPMEVVAPATCIESSLEPGVDAVEGALWMGFPAGVDGATTEA